VFGFVISAFAFASSIRRMRWQSLAQLGSPHTFSENTSRLLNGSSKSGSTTIGSGSPSDVSSLVAKSVLPRLGRH